MEDIIALEKSLFGSSIGLKTYANLNASVIREISEGNLSGFVTYNEHLDYYDIINLGVTKQLQKQGIASKLLNQIPFNKRVLLEVRSKNHAAIKTYQKNFFKQITIRKNYYGDDDALIFERAAEITELAYAKVNYLLNVFQKRADGFHDIEFIMDKINLADIVTVHPSHQFKFSFSNHLSDETIALENNIAYIAYQLLREKFSIKTTCHITINKKIPTAAGLGGGSADAAAVLRALNQLWDLQLSNTQLCEIGLEIGSDVPFCIWSKPMIVRGRGEILMPLPVTIPPRHMLIVNCRIPLKTKTVFENYQQIETKDINLILNDAPNFYQHCFNSLTKTAVVLEPKISNIIDEANQFKVEQILMSGSGPTVIIFDSSLEQLKIVEKKFANRYFTKLIEIGNN